MYSGKCPECGSDINEQNTYCLKCGYPLENMEINVRKCPECGKTIESNNSHCIYCGYPLEILQGIQATFKTCPECKFQNSIKEINCVNCCYPFEVVKEKSSGKKKNVVWIIVPVFLVFIAGLLFIISTSIRNSDEVKQIESKISSYESNIVEYKQLKSENERQAKSYTSAIFVMGYNNIADGYQRLIDDAEDSIEDLEYQKNRIIVKANVLTIFAVVLSVIGVIIFLWKRKKQTLSER